MLVFCQASYFERREQTLEGVKRLHDYVDRVVIIAPDYPQDFFKDYPKVKLHIVPWQDDFPKYRNEYLKQCNPGDWVCVADPDEWYGPELCTDLRRLTEEADKQGIGLLLVNSHDITTMPDGTIESSISNFFKNLIFKMIEGIHYKGVGVGLVHETLIIPLGTKTVSLPRKYYYEHIKTMVEIWERAFRNVWIAGGGNNVGDRNPRWRVLRRITDSLGLKSWPEVREYLRQGNIDKELFQWIRDCDRESGWDWQNEMFDCLKYYKAIHSEELPDIPLATELKLGEPSYGSPPEIMRYVEETYKNVFGRHADDRGKQHYTSAILAGQIRREDLPKMLMASQEYAEKFGGAQPSAPTEQVKVPLPINIQVGLSEELVEKVLVQSNLYWKLYKPRLDFAKRWEETIQKLKTPIPKPQEPDIEFFKTHVPPNAFLHILAFNLETAEALDRSGYKTVINAGENVDPHRLPFPEKYFDAVYYIDIIQHTLAPLLAISEVARILKDGGRIIVNTPSHLHTLMDLTDLREIIGDGRLIIYEKKS